MKSLWTLLAAGALLVGCDPECSRLKTPRVDALDASAWEASEWISVKDAPVADEATRGRQLAAPGTSCFRRRVVNAKRVASAVWMTTGLGVYELYVNGLAVGTDVLKPGFTHVEKTKYAFTYDVTALLRTEAGEANDFGAEVSAGWWRDKIVNYAGKKSAFRGVLELTYEDGSKELVGTRAAEWRGAVAGPVTRAGIFDGELYDARETNEARRPGESFAAGGCEANGEFKGEILPTAGAEVLFRDDLAMRKGPYSLQPGETLIVDFGQNCAAVPAFRFRAARGTVLTALPGEMLNDADKGERGCDGPKGSLYRANLRIPENGMRVVYTFAGDPVEVYRPRFSFFGYRYISLTATAAVEIEEIASVPVTSISKEMEIGSIETGDRDVNRLIANVYWGQLSNYLSVPTDCPQRNERLGWTADTQAFADAGAYNADTRRFFDKWMRDMRDTRNEHGSFPGVAPHGQYGSGPKDHMRTGWADAGIVTPWKIWRQFGNREIVDANWEAMEKFALHTCETKRDSDAIREESGDYQWNDWLSLDKFESASSGRTPELDAFAMVNGKWTRREGVTDYWSFLGACYWAIDMGMMKEMAAATGRDAAVWAAREEEAKAYLKEKFFKTADGTVRAPFDDMQTPAVMALKLGLVGGTAREKTIAFLTADLERRGNVTGFLGSSWLMDTLSANGREKLAVDLLLSHRFPSWLYSVDQGATTIWERWNGWTKDRGFGPVGMNSYNHYAYGQVLGWMYRRLAGIEPDPAEPGFRHILMRPTPDRRLGHVTASYRSAAGLIRSAWRFEGDRWIWDFTVPEGATASVVFPGETTERLYRAGTHRVERLLPEASAAAPATGGIPLPEHPRPDWERAAWLNLNGEWDFGFAADKLDRKILVPFGWGSPASGVRDEGDTGYYRRTVTVPAAWKGKRVFVVVGASDHDTTCTFAGDEIGTYSGGYVPFEFELTDTVRWGEEQTLEFKVWDPSPETAQNGHYLYGKQGYGNARGIWQTVYLEARGEEYLDSVRFEPDLAAARVGVRARLGAPARADGCVTVEIAGKRHELPFKAGEQTAVGSIGLDEPHLWTLDDPYLYDVTVRLGDADAVRTYFGFREIGVGRNPNGDSYVTLNGRPVYLRMCLDQSYHPEGWYTFPSDEAMKNEILLTKNLALSGNRVHIKVEVPRKLYWADRLGVLIQADVPCAWGDAGEKMFEEHAKCFAAMVKRDFNHPCIYQWTLFNETWGLFSNRSLEMGLASGRGGRERAYRADTQRRVADAYLRAKALDPTRLVEDNSPCNHDHVVTDVNTWHAYCPGYAWERSIAAWCEKTEPGSNHNFIGGNVQTDAPMMNSECGNVWGYAGSTGDCDFTWDYHLMMNAFRRHLKCGGWLYTEHHDVINEWNGYVRFDRTPKETGLDELAGMTLADFHRDAALFFAGRTDFETGELLAPGQAVKIPVGVSFVTDRYAGQGLSLAATCWSVDARGVRTEREIAGNWTGTGRSWQCEPLWEVGFTAPSEPACGCVCLTLSADGCPIAKDFWSFGVTNAAPAQVVASASEWSGGVTNVLDGLKLNGFGKGFFEFELPVGRTDGSLVFLAELSAKRKNGKDFATKATQGGLDYMLGGGCFDRSKNPNSYPQTSFDKHPARLKVYVNGTLAHTRVLPDDPADHRGILSWLSQPHDGALREAGSYGYPVEVAIPASAVRNGKVTVRLESDGGLAVYGPRFGRCPYGPQVVAR